MLERKGEEEKKRLHERVWQGQMDSAVSKCNRQWHETDAQIDFWAKMEFLFDKHSSADESCEAKLTYTNYMKISVLINSSGLKFMWMCVSCIYTYEYVCKKVNSK